FGVNGMPATASATAVCRPRDIAIVLDFSGSMRFQSETAYPPNADITGSLNPDPVVPRFGHWSAMTGSMQRATDYIDSGGEAHAHTVQEYLFGTTNNATYGVDNHAKSVALGPGGGAFDPLLPSAPLPTEGYGLNFKGYSMGPGYYGKTFYLWPPDPRWHPSTA